MALAVLLWSECASATGMTPEEKACCAAMGSECGEMAPQPTCCLIESQRVDQDGAINRAAITPSLIIVAALPSLPGSLHDPLENRGKAEHLPVKPPGVPTYLLASALLI